MSRILLAFAAVVGCSNQQSEPPAPAAPLTGHRQHAMRHCPSAVAGSITTMASRPDSVELRIVADDPTATREIVARAHAQARLGSPTNVGIHDGHHDGPGTIGFCPIIHGDTTVGVENVPGGVLVNVRPNNQSALPALRTATAARVAAIAIPSS